jgi:hypothetical protein
MMRVQIFPYPRAKAAADALNRERGRHSTTVLGWHSRISRRSGHWLSEYVARRLEDALGGHVIVHAHSRAAAHAGFYAVCTVAKSQQRRGLDLRDPHRRHVSRTTPREAPRKPPGIRHPGLRVCAGVLVLARARGLEPIRVTLPERLRTAPASADKPGEWVWDQAGRRYTCTSRCKTALSQPLRSALRLAP